MSQDRVRAAKFLLTVAGAMLLSGCIAKDSLKSQPDRVALVEGLQLFDSLLPVPPDSIVDLYSRFDPATFHAAYRGDLLRVRALIDSMNAPLNESERIDTLAIDHAIENVGNAARIKNTMYVSSSYFFLFNDPSVLRSLIMHEYGHVYYDRLSANQRRELVETWRALQERALFYIFRDGEYSGNARFGGHPDESPEELFASAYNLFWNREDELRVRLAYVDPQHYPIIERLKALVKAH